MTWQIKVEFPTRWMKFWVLSLDQLVEYTLRYRSQGGRITVEVFA